METTKPQDKSNYSANEIKIGIRMRWIETITIEKSINNIYLKLLLQFRLKKVKFTFTIFNCIFLFAFSKIIDSKQITIDIQIQMQWDNNWKQ